MTFQAWKMVLLNSMTFHDFPGRVVTLASSVYFGYLTEGQSLSGTCCSECCL